MLNMLYADLYKIYKSLAIRVIFGVTTICAIIMTLLAYLIPLGKVDASSSGIGFLFSDINVISILGAVVAGAFICSDFENKSIHEAITSGTGRGTVIIGKGIAFFVAVAAILIPYAVVAGIGMGTGKVFSMGNVGIGFLNLLTRTGDNNLDALQILKLLVIMLTMIFVYVAQVSFCVPLAVIIRKPVFVVACYYGFTILCAQLLGLRNSSKAFDDLFALTPYGGNHTFLTLSSSTGDIFKAIAVSAVFIVGMLSITYAVFRRAEIK